MKKGKKAEFCVFCHSAFTAFNRRKTCVKCQVIMCSSCKQTLNRMIVCEPCKVRYQQEEVSSESDSEIVQNVPAVVVPVRVKPRESALHLPTMQGKLTLASQRISFPNQFSKLENGVLSIYSTPTSTTPMVRISLDEDWIVRAGDETNKVAFSLARSVKISDSHMPTWIAHAPTENECKQWSGAMLQTVKLMGFDDEETIDENSPDAPAHFSGLLFKKGDDLLGAWKERRFAVYPKKQPHSLVYYAGDGSKREVPLSGNWQVDIPPRQASKSRPYFGFELRPFNPEERVFFLDAHSEQERETWVRVIRACIKNKQRMQEEEENLFGDDKDKEEEETNDFEEKPSTKNIISLWKKKKEKEKEKMPEELASDGQFLISGMIYEYDRGFWVRKHYGLQGTILRHAMTGYQLRTGPFKQIQLTYSCFVQPHEFQGKRFCLILELTDTNKMMLGFKTKQEQQLWLNYIGNAIEQIKREEDPAMVEGTFNYFRRRINELWEIYCKTPKQAMLVLSIIQIIIASFLLMMQLMGFTTTGTAVFSALMLLIIGANGIHGSRTKKGSSVRFFIYGNLWLFGFTFLFFVVHVRRLFYLGTDVFAALFLSVVDLVVLPLTYSASKQGRLLMKIINPAFETFGHDKSSLFHAPINFAAQNPNGMNNASKAGYRKFSESTSSTSIQRKKSVDNNKEESEFQMPDVFKKIPSIFDSSDK